jgi:hypothetical protein
MFQREGSGNSFKSAGRPQGMPVHRFRRADVQ